MWTDGEPPNLSGALLSIFDLLGDVLDELLLLGPFLVLQAKCLVLETTNTQNQFHNRLSMTTSTEKPPVAAQSSKASPNRIVRRVQ